MGKSKYIHTLDGKPAYYYKNEQIYFARNGVKLSELFVYSLRTIRKQQQLSAEWRAKQGFGNDYAQHGYLRVRVEEGE